VKQKLLQLYQTHQTNFKNVRNLFPNDDLKGPCLISPNTKYDIQANPLLIIGQETKGWECFVDDIEKQMKVYEDFNLGEKYYRSPYYNVTRKVEDRLGNERYSNTQTNINKFDVGGKHPKGKHEIAIAFLDKILIDEIKILKPKVCIFFTGHSFDNRLNNIFSALEFIEIPEFNKMEFCQLKHELLPELSFRAYHPGYLRRKGKERKFLDFIGKLSSNVNSILK
jgi:hypothetical protein